MNPSPTPYFDADTGIFHNTPIQTVGQLYGETAAIIIVVAVVLIVAYYAVKAYLGWRRS